MLAATGTNVTRYVHSNMVQLANCGGGSYGAMSAGGSATDFLTLAKARPVAPAGPLARPANGSGGAVPLKIYPPGFDVSDLLISDPLTGEWMSGAGYSIRPTPRPPALEAVQLAAPAPPGGGGGGSFTSNSGAETGFYRVVRQGARLLGVTNGMVLSGVVAIFVEAGNASGELASLSITEAGSPVSDLSTRTAPFGPVTVDTTQMTNGAHQISAAASWCLPGGEGQGGVNPYIEAVSPPVTVIVQNEISFTDWMPMFGQEYDSLLITAQSAHANTEWYIDIYDSSTNYIGSFEGTTTDGMIGAVWDLRGPQGEYHDDNWFRFVVGTPYGSAVSPKSWKNWDRWTARGDWVVGNQLAWEGVIGGENFDTMTDGFVVIGQTFDLTVRPPGIDPGTAFRIHYALLSDPRPDQDWQQFRQALYYPSSRNLFYSGHGGNGGIGRNPANTNRYISQAELVSALHNVPSGQTNRHGFRFVFLDGCQTANGHLAQAFGIIEKKEVSFGYLEAAGIRPASFVGWNKSPAAAFANNYGIVAHWEFIQNFQFLWGTGRGLRQALDEAKDGPLHFNVDVDPRELTVFGFRNLGVNQYNGQFSGM
ncbi:MAG: hypothetical protein HZA90_02375 [Verrucomicrobia bacterium]|nr:hypothetical protein [Verrucomicrobiota bacterium]